MIYKEPIGFKIVDKDAYDELMSEYYGMFGHIPSTPEDNLYHPPKTFGPSTTTTTKITPSTIPTPMEKQVGGDHYKTMKIQPMEYILANNLGWAEGNVIKYTTRHKSKGGKQDLEKAIHMLQLIIELEYPNG